MSGTETADLDALLSETLGHGPSFKLYGRTWHFKPEVPSLLMLRIRRAAANPDEQLTDEQELELLGALLDPPSQADELVAAGLGSTAHATIIRIAIGVYSGQSPAETLEQMRAERQAAADLDQQDDQVSQGKARSTTLSRSGRGSKRT